MRKIYISAGHTSILGKDRGAVSGKYVEGVLAEELRSMVAKELEKLHIPFVTDGNNTVLADTMNNFKKTADTNSILVEFHFNAATPKATGVETLVPNNPTITERQLAEAISKTISQTLGIQIRGAKGVKTEKESARGSLGWMRIQGENVLPEICFITNSSDMQKYEANKEKLAKNIANILAEYSQIGDAPKEEQSQKECFYTVQKGDTLWEISKKENISVANLKKINNLKSDVLQIGQVLKV